MSNKTKKRTLLKIDDTLIEVGPETKTLSPDEVFETQILEDNFEQMFANDLNKIANEAYAQMCSTLKSNIISASLRALGFEQDWGNGWRVDHCNGRISVVSEVISEKVRTLFTQEMNALFEKDKDSILKAARKTAALSFKENFLYYVQSQVREAARDAADEFVKKLVQKEVASLEKEATIRAKAAMLGKQLNLKKNLKIVSPEQNVEPEEEEELDG